MAQTNPDSLSQRHYACMPLPPMPGHHQALALQDTAKPMVVICGTGKIPDGVSGQPQPFICPTQTLAARNASFHSWLPFP